MGFLPSSAAAFIYLFKPPYAIGPVPSLSGHATAYRWRSLPKVRRHRTSKPQGSSERMLPWQISMDQLICASLSHTHYWYEVGMLKVPAVSRSRPRIRISSGDRAWTRKGRSPGNIPVRLVSHFPVSAYGNFSACWSFWGHNGRRERVAKPQ